MPNAFAFSKIFVAVLTASQLIGAAQAASVVINQSQSEAVSISENATASYYGAFTVDSSWHDGYSGIASPQYRVSNTFTLEKNATITQPALVNGDIYGQNNTYFGVFIGRFGQIDKIVINGRIDTSVGIYSEGTIGQVLTDPGQDTVISDYALVVNGEIDTTEFGKATTIKEPNAIQNTWAGVIGGSVLIASSSKIKTEKDGHELLNAGSIYGNIVVESDESHEILNRKPAGGRAAGLITGEIVNKAKGVLSVYNEGSILSGVKNEGTGSVRIVNQNLIAGKELIANSLYNVPYSAIEGNGLKYQSMNDSGTTPKIEINGNIKITESVLNYGSIKAQSADIANLDQAAASSELTVSGALTLSGITQNSGTIRAGTAEIANITQNDAGAKVSVTGKLLLKGNSSFLQGAASAGTLEIAEGASVNASSVGLGAAYAGHSLSAGSALTVNGSLHSAGSVDIGTGTTLTVAKGALFSASAESPVTIAGTVSVKDSIAVGAGASAAEGFVSQASSFKAEGNASVTARNLTVHGADTAVVFGGASKGVFDTLTLKAGSFEAADGALIKTGVLTATADSSLSVAKTLAVGGDIAEGLVLDGNLDVKGTLTAGTLAVTGKNAVFESGSKTSAGMLTADGAMVVLRHGASVTLTGANGSVSLTNGSALTVQGDLALGSASGAAGLTAEKLTADASSVTVTGVLSLNDAGAELTLDNGASLQAANLSILKGKLTVDDGLLIAEDSASTLTVGAGASVTLRSDVTMTDSLPGAASVMALAEDEAEAQKITGLVSLQSSADIAGTLASKNLTVEGESAKRLTVTGTGSIHGATLTLDNSLAVVTFESGSDSELTGNLILKAGRLVIENGADLELTSADCTVEVAGGARLEVGDMVLVSAGAMPDSASGLRANAAEITVAGELDAQSLIVNRADSHVTFKSGAWGYIASLNLQTGTLAVERGAMLEMGAPSSDRRAALGIDAANEAVLDHNDNKPLVVNQAKVAVGSVDLTKLNAGDVYFASDSHFVIDTRNDIGGVGHLHSDHEGSVLTVDSGAKLTVVNAAMGRHLIAKGFTASDSVAANWDKTLRVMNLNETGLTLQVQVAGDEVILDVPVPDTVDEEMSAPGIIDSIIEGDNFELRDTESDAEDIKFITSVVEPGIFTEGTESGVDVTKSAHYYNSVIEFGAASGFRAYAIDQVQTMADIRDAFLSRDPSPDRNVWGHLVARRSGMNALFSAASMKGGYRANTEGIVLGADFYATDTARAGVSLHYLKGHLRSHGDYELTKTTSHIVGLSLYGKKKFGNASLQSQVSWSYGSAGAHQSFNDLIGRTYEISGRMKTNSLLAGVRAEYALDLGAATLTPHAGVRYIGNHYASFDTRINGQGAFSNSSKNVNLLQTPVGISLKAGVDTAEVKWTGFADASYVPQIGRKNVTGTVSAKHFNASDDYSQNVAGNGYMNVALGVTALKGAHSFGVTYNGNFGSKNYRSSGLMARYNYRF